MTNEVSIDGWHFSGPRLRDGSPLPAKGETLSIPDNVEIEPCASGYHASKRAIDALLYAPGTNVARVQLSGNLVQHGDPPDKWVGRYRLALSDYVDVEEELGKFSRDCALSVAHLWDAPPVVLRFLTTGDTQSREAAWEAAWVAARDAARDATSDAARDAARASARVATRAAAKAATWTAAGAAAGAVAWTAARAVAWTAAGAAAWTAAGAVARTAAFNRFRARQNTELEALLHKRLEVHA